MINELPLNPFWKKRGCVFKEERGWRLPAFFESPEADYRKAAERCGISDLSFRGKIELRGKDRVSFLHNLLTHDIQNLAPGGGCRAMLLNAAGKILADMNVHIFEDSVLLDTEMGLQKKLLDLLDRYLITEDVRISDQSGACIHLSLQGPETASVLRNFFQTQIPARPFQNASLLFDSIPLIFFCLTDPIKTEYQFLIPKEKAVYVIEKILAGGEKNGPGLTGCDAAEILRLERGELRYGWEMSEDILLPETGLEDLTASETKGCYPGQEVVARIRTYKGLKRKITGLILNEEKFRTDQLPASGDRICAGETNSETGKEIGRIATSCLSIRLKKGIALGYLEKGFADPGEEVTIQSASGKISARTAALPFVL